MYHGSSNSHGILGSRQAILSISVIIYEEIVVNLFHYIFNYKLHENKKNSSISQNIYERTYKSIKVDNFHVRVMYIMTWNNAYTRT